MSDEYDSMDIDGSRRHQLAGAHDMTNIYGNGLGAMDHLHVGAGEGDCIGGDGFGGGEGLFYTKLTGDGSRDLRAVLRLAWRLP